MNDIEYRIPIDLKEFQEYDLFRWKILRKPIGKSIESLKETGQNGLVVWAKFALPPEDPGPENAGQNEAQCYNLPLNHYSIFFNFSVSGLSCPVPSCGQEANMLQLKPNKAIVLVSHKFSHRKLTVQIIIICIYLQHKVE